MVTKNGLMNKLYDSIYKPVIVNIVLKHPGAF